MPENAFGYSERLLGAPTAFCVALWIALFGFAVGRNSAEPSATSGADSAALLDRIPVQLGQFQISLIVISFD